MSTLNTHPLNTLWHKCTGCTLRRARIWLVTSSFCCGDNSMVAAWPDPSSLWRAWLARLEYMHFFIIFIISEKLQVLRLVNPINITNQTFIMKHRPVAPGWGASRTSVAMCTCTRVGHYQFMQPKWTPAEFYVNSGNNRLTSISLTNVSVNHTYQEPPPQV